MTFQPEQLYLLILKAESITDEQKKALIDRLNNEGMTSELGKELDEIFAREEHRLGNFIEEKKKELNNVKKDLAIAEKEALPELEKLEKATEQDFEATEKEYSRKMREEIEIPFDKEVEGIQKTDEQNKIATIRNKLKTPPKTS